MECPRLFNSTLSPVGIYVYRGGEHDTAKITQDSIPVGPGDHPKPARSGQVVSQSNDAISVHLVRFENLDE
jgi:hypothetical protein